MTATPFDRVDHRPWPPPRAPWAWRQTWHDLLFLHWPVPVSQLRSLVPPELEIQEFGGSAWFGVVPFWMSGVTPRGWPDIPGLSSFPELNVRTYVSRADRPGVWFLSLDAANRVAIWVARGLYRLPYVYARMNVEHDGARIDYRSMRPTGQGFEGSYQPDGPVVNSAPGTLEHFLTERYCLYARSRSGALHCAEVHHAAWPLQRGAATIRRNDMLGVHGIEIDAPPSQIHYAKRLDVRVWRLARIDGASGVGRAGQAQAG